MVEQKPEELRVGGSIPFPGTILRQDVCMAGQSLKYRFFPACISHHPPRIVCVRLLKCLGTLMTLLPSEKSNIAWFKLAEFVYRKEKERALGLVRLLSHAVPSPALVAQLEGDLLWSFGDEKALELYEKAARTYTHDGRASDAQMLYRQLAIMYKGTGNELGVRRSDENVQALGKLTRSKKSELGAAI